jgi:hypothetical protein
VRLLIAAALGTFCLVAAAEPQHPPYYPPKAPAKLRASPVDQPAHPLVIATGDFDGDSLPDTVERIPGARPNSLRIQARLAAHPDTPYFIVEGSPASEVEATLVKVGPAGVYVLEKVARTELGEVVRDEQGKVRSYSDPTAMPRDVVLVRVDRPNWHGFDLRYWSERSDGFVGVSWPDPKVDPKTPSSDAGGFQPLP